MRQRGFTLIEVLVALLILTLVITTTLGVFLERNRKLQQASEIIVAYQALANESEEWRRKEFATLGDDDDDDDEKFSSDLAILAPLEPYHAVASVEVVTPDVKRVKLTIRWANGKRNASLTLMRVKTGGTNLW